MLLREPPSRSNESTGESREREWDGFVRERTPSLIALLSRKGASIEDAKDVVQESMIKLLKYRDQPRSAWEGLIYRIAINHYYDFLRKSKASASSVHVTIDGLDVPSEEVPHELWLITEETKKKLQRLIRNLPERCREVYLLNREEGMSYSEVANHLGVSVKTVEKHISSALSQLRLGLSEPNEGKRF